MAEHLVPNFCIIVAALSAGAVFALPLLAAWLLWIIRRGESVFIDDHGRESMNFQVTLLIYCIVAIVPTLVTCTFGGLVFYPAIGALALAGTILATRAAWQGRVYRYPITLRFIKPAM